MKIQVAVYSGPFRCGPHEEIAYGRPDHEYTMDHNDPAQRRVLGEQCRNAFEAGQCVLTYPVAA